MASMKAVFLVNVLGIKKLYKIELFSVNKYEQRYRDVLSLNHSPQIVNI